MINNNIEVYIYDIMVKSKSKSTHINELNIVFEWMLMHNLKITLLNVPLVCKHVIFYDF
jgi:hypothetical protein